MTTAFIVGGILGTLGGFTLACLFASNRITSLQERVGFHEAANDHLRHQLFAVQAVRGQIFLSQADVETLRGMGIGL